MIGMIKLHDFVAMTAKGYDWYGYVVQFIEPNQRGIEVQWSPDHSSWHNYDELRPVDFPAERRPARRA